MTELSHQLVRERIAAKGRRRAERFNNSHKLTNFVLGEKPKGKPGWTPRFKCSNEVFSVVQRALLISRTACVAHVYRHDVR